MADQFICVRCGQLTTQCVCNHQTQGQLYETELAWCQKVMRHITAIEAAAHYFTGGAR